MLGYRGNLHGERSCGIAGSMRQDVIEAARYGDWTVALGEAQVGKIQRLEAVHVDVWDSCNTVCGPRACTARDDLEVLTFCKLLPSHT